MPDEPANMNLKDLNLKRSYDSDSDDILNDFYIPSLSNSIKYKRLAGFFSTNSLAIAAKGVSKFILNGGFMELICGARFSKTDIIAINEAYENPESILEKNILNDLCNFEDEFIRDHLKAVAWMIAHGQLHIKIAIVINEMGKPIDGNNVDKEGIFHQKVGIFEDINGNKISFSGSDNETARAWLENIEEFKVFCNWNNQEKDYFIADYERFQKFWNGFSKRAKVIDIPIAIREKLIEIAPENLDQCNLQKWLKKDVKRMKNSVELRAYQNQAIANWIDNGKKGIFIMATGTGKTFTALGCLNRILNEEHKLITIIACPFDHLIKQWIDDIYEFNIILNIVIADSSNPGWKHQLANNLLDIKNGINDRVIILTTHKTASGGNFLNILRQYNDVKSFFIVDEVHGMGAPKRREGLIDAYNFRLGLSATPERWFDEEGTEALFKYFGGAVFEFSLKEAINNVNPDTGETFLTPYEYKPYFIEMSDEEMILYEEESNKIAKAYFLSNERRKKDELFSQLCFRRQRIIENASEKYTALLKILNDIGTIEYCLIYCSPKQLNGVQDILNEQRITQHKFTMKEGVNSEKRYGGYSERNYLIHKLEDRTYKALVAVKCLDEGVDIPPARIAIIMASTSNPRQYIQRRGRVLRRFPGKERATIYDIIVTPCSGDFEESDLRNLEKRILEKELKRYKEFAYTAVNTLECLSKIEKLEEKYKLVI